MMTLSGKMYCVRCTKPKTTAKCSGCMQDFCLNHLIEHNQDLERDFNDLENQRNILWQNLSEQSKHLDKHVLFKQIIQWETESIRKIQQIADKQKTILSNSLNRHFVIVENQFNQITQKLKEIRHENDFNEILLIKLQRQLNELEQNIEQPSNIFIRQEADTISVLDISTQINMKWNVNGLTVVGGNGYGEKSNQCTTVLGMCIDADKTIYVVDSSNHRIVEWKTGAITGRVVAGGNGRGNRNDQLEFPETVIRDYTTNSLIISDRCNKRLVRWSCRQGTTQGETIISKACCWGLAMDKCGYLYGSIVEKHEVRRWKLGEDDCGIVVAGGNGVGTRLDQFNAPRYIFVDQKQTIYISDSKNHRVIKWPRGAKEGVIVAGGNGIGKSLSQLSNPQGIFVDQFGTVYVADFGNHRIVRWLVGVKEGHVVIGDDGRGDEKNQLDCPTDLTFDNENNLYVADRDNRRVQKFLIDYVQ